LKRRRTRLFPSPLLSASLFAMWLTLARSLSVSHIVLGATLAFIIPRITGKLRSSVGTVRRPLIVVRFILTVGYDVLKSNVEVAWGVLTWRFKRPDARFIIIPLELRDPHGLAALAMVTTVVPGTVWSELALDRSALMLHAWDVQDDERFIRRFKARYEQPLREIFE
jgi:multicomponent K+:H+ antiporter subunit E